MTIRENDDIRIDLENKDIFIKEPCVLDIFYIFFIPRI